MTWCGVQAVFKDDSLVDGEEDSDFCGGECGQDDSRHAHPDATAAHATDAHAPQDGQPREPSHIHITIAKELKKNTYHALFVAQSLLDMVQREKRGRDGGAEESDALALDAGGAEESDAAALHELPLDALTVDGVAVAEMMVTLVAELLRELFAAHLHWSNPPPPP